MRPVLSMTAFRATHREVRSGCGTRDSPSSAWAFGNTARRTCAFCESSPTQVQLGVGNMPTGSTVDSIDA